jgi:phospholipid/cholesterol/gamma-HCH transport system substrate-binding protein
MKISKEFKVGLFMIVAIVLLYFGFNFLKGIDFFSSSNTYYAFYENVDKLAESNTVMLNGYAVGRVSKIEIQQAKNRVLVTMDIDTDIVLGDSSLAVLNGELLGGRFIQLEIERNIRRPLQPEDTLHAEVAKGIADFIAENASPIADNLSTTFRKINIILDALANNTRRIDSIFIELKLTPQLLNKTLATTNKNIDGLGGSFQSVAANLNGTLSELKPTLENLKVFSDSLKTLQINAAISNAEQALGNLNQTLAKVNNGKNTISKLMNDDEVYVNLNKLLNSLDTLANHLDQNPRHFFSPFGKKSKVKK